ncbi:MAG: hypothetical protein OXS32_08885 [Verrucomicrobiales bacterium]|nr:hypothetical protein [Verrucomicrobiales bacterium]
MAEEIQQPKVQAKQAKEVRLPTSAYGLALSSDDNLCHVTGMDGGVHEVEIPSGETKRIGGHDSYAASLERLPGSQTLISAGYDGRILWHDLAKRELVRDVKARDFWSWQMKVSDDETRLDSVTGRYARICKKTLNIHRTLRLWRLQIRTGPRG